MTSLLYSVILGTLRRKRQVQKFNLEVCYFGLICWNNEQSRLLRSFYAIVDMLYFALHVNRVEVGLGVWTLRLLYSRDKAETPVYKIHNGTWIETNEFKLKKKRSKVKEMVKRII